jgi:nitronate monooxygenase
VLDRGLLRLGGGWNQLAARLRAQLRLPVMAGPMFIASTAELVIAQCLAGIIGAMPALNPRSTTAWTRILRASGSGRRSALLHQSRRAPDEPALEADLDVILRHKVPSWSWRCRQSRSREDPAGQWQPRLPGRHPRSACRKCAEMGVDGIIAVGAGAGGHTGDQSPFALMQEIREWWDGLLILSGCIATGRSVLAAEMLGADLAYIGSAFLASSEANTQQHFKDMVVASAATDIVTTTASPA